MFAGCFAFLAHFYWNALLVEFWRGVYLGVVLRTCAVFGCLRASAWNARLNSAKAHFVDFGTGSILVQQNRLLASGVAAGVTFCATIFVEPLWSDASGATTFPQVAAAVQNLATLYQEVSSSFLHQSGLVVQCCRANCFLTQECPAALQSLVLYLVRAVGQQIVSHRIRKRYRAHKDEKPSKGWKLAYFLFDSDDEGHAPDSYLQVRAKSPTHPI